MTARVVFLLATVVALGCKQALPTTPPAAAAAADAVSSDEVAAAPDLCATGIAPCALAPAEKCTACFQRIAQCCYHDADIQGRIELLVAACEAKTACRRCCDECAAMTCAQFTATHSCPPPPMP